ncbi:putative non-specific serine/threonine protein kinase [Helianthus anomalus]
MLSLVGPLLLDRRFDEATKRNMPILMRHLFSPLHPRTLLPIGNRYKAGLEELAILKELVGADLEDKRHCVRFLSSFKYRNHLCLVFESLHMNLREVWS